MVEAKISSITNHTKVFSHRNIFLWEKRYFMPKFISCWEEIIISRESMSSFIFEYSFKIYSMSIRIYRSSFLLSAYIHTVVARCCLSLMYMSIGVVGGLSHSFIGLYISLFYKVLSSISKTTWIAQSIPSSFSDIFHYLTNLLSDI